jgi:hypothetical protein
MYPRNQAVTGFTFGLVAAADGSAVGSGTVSGYVTLDGGAQTSLSGVPVHEGHGQWSVDLSAAEMNGAIVGLVFTHADAVPAHFTLRTVASQSSSSPAATGDFASDLAALRSLWLARLLDLESAPKPSYQVDGQHVDWNAYRARLRENVDWATGELQAA